MLGDDPTHGPRHRVRVFVDFWNYTLAMRDIDGLFRTDWAKLGPVLSNAAAAVVGAAQTHEYQGLNFYGSHDPASNKDRRLRRWAETVVASSRG